MDVAGVNMDVARVNMDVSKISILIKIKRHAIRTTKFGWVRLFINSKARGHGQNTIDYLRQRP